MNAESFLTKLRWNLPWLARYPFVRAADLFRPAVEGQKHLIFTIADHFEPSWSAAGGLLDRDSQLRNLDAYYELARKTGDAVRDADGTRFRHTNFFPAEQYDRGILEKMAAMQADGLGEVEIHLHHGVEKPDTAENTRRVLTEFRDRLADEHQCLSRLHGTGKPMYAFVHGNLALANSAGGKYCGVDEEMQILADTGCYADFTMPSAPDMTQVPMINQIYQCGLPLASKIPHRKGTRVAVGARHLQLPLIFTGPLVFNWTRRIRGLPVPRLEDGALAENQALDTPRLRRWISANVTVKGRPDWIFIKLYCHGFFAYDQSACIGERAIRFFSETIEHGEKSGEFKVHFASAREAFNIAAAAIEGKQGSPGEFRDFQLRAIMNKDKQKVE